MNKNEIMEQIITAHLRGDGSELLKDGVVLGQVMESRLSDDTVFYVLYNGELLELDDFTILRYPRMREQLVEHLGKIGLL